MRLFFAGLGIAVCALGQVFPEAEISSAAIRAKLYLPDAQKGYYRGTRFDWSGAISSLKWSGHEYFGKWFVKYDPKLHDAITGPVEEFAPLGYDEAKSGERFVKIGVGALLKPAEVRYRQFGTYEIADGGVWRVKQGREWIRFEHRLAGAYEYRKTVRLEKNRPELVIEHRLRNTGAKTLETNVYQHNFFMLDGQPAGPAFRIRFPFAVRAERGLGGAAEPRGREVVFLRELGTGQSVYGELTGFGAAVSDYDIRVENATSGAGVRQTCDRPLSRLVLWSIRTTVCPEAYVSMRIEPGKAFAWTIRYAFYAAGAGGGSR